jgi:Tfp pilus assembly protein PilZ
MKEGRQGNTKSTPKDRRESERIPVFEFALLWRPNGTTSYRSGSAFITNASIGGLQFKTNERFSAKDNVMLEIGYRDRTTILPGVVRYVIEEENGNRVNTYGLKFTPKNKEERVAIAEFILSLCEKVVE